MRNEGVGSKKLRFICPNDGEIARENVAFLCNTCKKENLLKRGDLFLCPRCLKEGKNFQCMVCQSDEVAVLVDGEKVRHL